MEPITEQLISRFKALANPVRVRLIALCARGECSVSELTAVLGLSQPRVSQHLKALCDTGLVERFRDGHFVYYCAPLRGGNAAARRRLLALLPIDEPQFEKDAECIRELRGAHAPGTASSGDTEAESRALHRALVELTVSRPLGDLIDVGCGQGRLLKLLASRARRAVGVDIDPDARRFARAELLLAGLPNCTLRKGDMHSLPFGDAEFDTVILDDVLDSSERPVEAINEAKRLLRPGGRILVLASVGSRDASDVAGTLAAWSRATHLRLSTPRSIPTRSPHWILAVLTRAEPATAAA